MHIAPMLVADCQQKLNGKKLPEAMMKGYIHGEINPQPVNMPICRISILIFGGQIKRLMMVTNLLLLLDHTR